MTKMLRPMVLAIFAALAAHCAFCATTPPMIASIEVSRPAAFAKHDSALPPATCKDGNGVSDHSATGGKVDGQWRRDDQSEWTFTATTVGGPFTVSAMAPPPVSVGVSTTGLAAPVGGTASVIVTPVRPPPVLTTITVAPLGATVSVGATQQFTPTASRSIRQYVGICAPFHRTVSGGGTISGFGAFHGDHDGRTVYGDGECQQRVRDSDGDGCGTTPPPPILTKSWLRLGMQRFPWAGPFQDFKRWAWIEWCSCKSPTYFQLDGHRRRDY